jgi:NADPH:quinone reductase-like Zn-dependent oxidoreductase
VEEKKRLRDGVEQHLWPLFGSGKMRPIIDSAMEQAAEAHPGWSQHIGKILRVSK